MTKYQRDTGKVHVVTIRNNTKNKRISIRDGVTKRRLICLGDSVHLRGTQESMIVTSILKDGMVRLVSMLSYEYVITNVRNIVKNRRYVG